MQNKITVSLQPLTHCGQINAKTKMLTSGKDAEQLELEVCWREYKTAQTL